MSERNITQFGVLAMLVDFFDPLRWILIAALVIILVDLRFGVLAAKKRGEVVRFSRAIRRTVNKIVDYICWIILAGVIGQAFGEPFHIPLLPFIMLLVIFGCEVNSCFSNYFESKGKKIKVDFFRIFRKKIDILEPEIEEKPTQKTREK